MKRLSVLVITLSFLLIPTASFAATGDLNGSANTGFPSGSLNGSANTGTQAAPTYNPTSGGSGQVTNPLGNINSFCGLIKALLSAIIAIGIPVAVLFIVFAGFKFVMAQGNAGELQKARQNLMYTLIGIGIFLGAWLLALVIANTVNALGAGSTSSQIISCN